MTVIVNVPETDFLADLPDAPQGFSWKVEHQQSSGYKNIWELLLLDEQGREHSRDQVNTFDEVVITPADVRLSAHYLNDRYEAGLKEYQD